MLPSACSKLSTNSKQYAIAQRLLKSYFVSLQNLLSTVSSTSDTPSYAVTESANLIPWIVGNRKVARGLVKMLLGVYEGGASDETKVQAFAALRKLAIAADHSLRESIMKVRLSAPAETPLCPWEAAILTLAVVEHREPTPLSSPPRAKPPSTPSPPSSS